MPTTTTYGFPYPGTGDSPHGPNQIQALAQAVEDKIELVDADEALQKAMIQGYAPPTQSGSGTISSGVSLVVASFSIPAPGYSYYIFVSGSIGWSVVAASIPGRLFEGAITIDSTVYDTNRIVGGYQVSQSIGANFTQPTLIIPEKRSDAIGAQSGGHVIRLIARNTSTPAADMTVPAAGIDTTLTVRIVPAT